MSSAIDWTRVGPRSRCPVCGGDSWCTVAPDASAVRCKRTESDHPAHGEDGEAWLHVLDSRADRPRTPRARREFTAPSRPDFGPRVEQLVADMPSDLLERFARHVGVSAAALRSLATGWDGQRRCLTWPMVDGTGRVVGVRLRDARTGRKFALRGSREGLFVPRGTEATDPLVVAEGVTDTAAALDLGFDAVGRPSCTGGTRPLARLTHGRRVVIVRDADAPGRRGAASLASALLPTVIELRVVEPPQPFKDVRDWLVGGAGHGDMLALIEAAEPRRIRVDINLEGVRRGR